MVYQHIVYNAINTIIYSKITHVYQTVYKPNYSPVVYYANSHVIVVLMNHINVNHVLMIITYQYNNLNVLLIVIMVIIKQYNQDMVDVKNVYNHV
jgi:hypothetical protein